MLEKTYTTFHSSNMLLQQQYRECHFTKYTELIAFLLVAEQNNDLLLKNHQSRSTVSITLPEANATIQTNRRGHGSFYGRGRCRSRGHHISWNQGDYNQPHNKKNKSNNQKLNHSKILPEKATKPHNKRVCETECYRCGMKVTGHVPVVQPSIWLAFIKPPLKEKVTKLRPTLLMVKGQWILMILIKSPSKKLTIKLMTISLIMMVEYL